MTLLKELVMFMYVKKKLWLAPIILTILLFGTLLILSEGSVIAPFIYTLF
jgi:hypothetical protein